MSIFPAQLQSFSLAGGGNAIADTTLVLSSFNDIDGNALSMTSFGAKGYGTVEPANGMQEEQISFTGLTTNSNGTVTLTGVSHVTFLQPFTETSGMTKQHPGGATFIISNTSGYENQDSIVANDEVITGKWQFPNNASTPILGLSYVAPTLQYQVASKGYVDAVAITGAPNASTSVQGLVQLATGAQVLSKTATGSTGATLVSNPSLQASTLLSDYVADTGTPNTYVIAPSPAITGYTVGQIFSFKALHGNSGASTLAVNGLAAKNIYKNGQYALNDGDIVTGAIVQVEYDGTQFQLISPSSLTKISQSGVETYATSTTGNTVYVVGYTPAVSAYVAGLTLRFKPDTGSLGGATINVNGLGAKTIKTYYNGALQTLKTGDIVANQIAEVTYDGTQMQLMNPSSKPIFYNSFVGTRAGDASTATVNYAHSLGRIPNKVKVTAMSIVVNGNNAQASGTYNGTTTSGVYSGWNASTAAFMGTSSSNILTLSLDTSGDTQTATATMDATNVILAWTRTGSTPSTVIQLMFEVE